MIYAQYASNELSKNPHKYIFFVFYFLSISNLSLVRVPIL
jgi:hypothetical protein